MLAQFQTKVDHFPRGIIFHANSVLFEHEIKKHLAEAC